MTFYRKIFFKIIAMHYLFLANFHLVGNCQSVFWSNIKTLTNNADPLETRDTIVLFDALSKKKGVLSYLPNAKNSFGQLLFIKKDLRVDSALIITAILKVSGNPGYHEYFCGVEYMDSVAGKIGLNVVEPKLEKLRLNYFRSTYNPESARLRDVSNQVIKSMITDFSKWQKVRIEVKKDMITLFINNKLIFWERNPNAPSNEIDQNFFIKELGLGSTYHPQFRFLELKDRSGVLFSFGKDIMPINLNQMQ